MGSDDDDVDVPVPVPASATLVPRAKRARLLESSSSPNTNKSCLSNPSCPYLDMVDRKSLNFDFAKFCSVTLSPQNVYCCLTCGKFFTGKSTSSPAYTHSVSTSHYVFMALDKKLLGRVFVLPDNYEVVDRSLDDIRAALNPTYTPQAVASLDAKTAWARALDGADYLPGLVGLNNLAMAAGGASATQQRKANQKAPGSTDYLNVIAQLLVRAQPLRDYFLLQREADAVHASAPSAQAADTQNRVLLVQRFSELCRKVWHPTAFKGHVSPHEFLQAVQHASNRAFNADEQGDPQAFLAWLLDAMHLGLTAGKRKKASVITRCFQGELDVRDASAGESAEDASKAAEAAAAATTTTKFLMLGLDLPDTPLHLDAKSGATIIPQVPLSTLLQKYNGSTVHESLRSGSKTYRITKLPRYLVLNIKRFLKNNFFFEKNRTLVTFPLEIDLRDILPLSHLSADEPTRYRLVANVCHDGEPSGGTYKVHILRPSDEKWYEVHDLRVSEIMHQMVGLSEAYVQLWERL